MVALKFPALIEVKEKDDGGDGSPFTALTKQGQQFTTSFEKNTKKLSPVTFVDVQTKDFLKRKLRENRLLIWRSCVEGSIYCALFHETKRLLKRKTSKHRRLGPAVKYLSDVMLPDGLFGPVIGFVIRLKFFS
ncbi:hypothetical protein WJX77_004867 [Trebouxia sp. C0004]